MYAETVDALGAMASDKLAHQRRSILAHLIRAALAGMYIGAAIVLILVVGAGVASVSPALAKPVMGICFGGALTMVYFAGSELFTGTNLVLTVGVLTGRATGSQLAANWTWTWIGNLAGSALLAVLVFGSGVLEAEPARAFVMKFTETKMTLPPGELICRAVLANWLVCAGVWMAARMKSESGKLLMIWWCMFTFIACSFEHSVANMSGLLVGLLLDAQPSAAGHAHAGITMGNYAYNLALATFGNILGGAVLVGAAYWLASPNRLRRATTATQPRGLSSDPPVAMLANRA